MTTIDYGQQIAMEGGAADTRQGGGGVGATADEMLHARWESVPGVGRPGLEGEDFPSAGAVDLSQMSDSKSEYYYSFCPGAEEEDPTPIQAISLSAIADQTHQNQANALVVRGRKCHTSTEHVTDNDIESLAYGKCLETWNFRRRDFAGPFTVLWHEWSLIGRAVYLGWDDAKVEAVVEMWHQPYILPLAVGWEARIWNITQTARSSATPRRNAKPKAATKNWTAIQAVLANLEVMSAKEIADATGLDDVVVRQQLHRKVKMGWLQQPAYGFYRLTSLCGVTPPRTSQPVPAEPEYVPSTYTLADLSTLLRERECLESQLCVVMSYNQDLRDELAEVGTFVLIGDHFRATQPLIDSLIEIADALYSLGWNEPEAPPTLQDLAEAYFLSTNTSAHKE